MGENILNHQKAAACNHELLLVKVSDDFDLERAVCNHGYFMMAPNYWIPSCKALIRPLRLNNNNSSKNKNSIVGVTVSITQPPSNKNFLYIWVLHSKQHHHRLSNHDQQLIQDQVSRMLRISERDDMMVKEFHSVCPEAKKLAFARIFRSPTLFEDIVKSILLCYSTWSKSLKMAEALCDLEQKSKRKRTSSSKSRRLEECCGIFKSEYCSMGNFPSPKEIARLSKERLNKSCNLGYRASIIIKIAQEIENGNLSLNLGDLFDDQHYITLYQRLMKIKDFGPFVVANIMMCIGFYRDIPVDTETIKHLEQVHGKKGLSITKKYHREVIAQIYDKYAPFQCLVYWMERVKYYEEKVGKLSKLPHSKYSTVATTKLTK